MGSGLGLLSSRVSWYLFVCIAFLMLILALLWNSNKVAVLLTLGVIILLLGLALKQRRFTQVVLFSVILLIGIWMSVSVPRQRAKTIKTFGDVGWSIGDQARAVENYQRINLDDLEEADRKIVSERINEFLASPEDKVRRRLNEWLEVQKKGETGEGFWSGSEYSRLYSVRSGLVLKVSVMPSGSDAQAKVRIDSSNKGGNPITKTWIIELVKEGYEKKWMIKSMTDADGDKHD